MESDRCPSCAAAVRVDADWCTLCYADLRPAPPPVERPPYPHPSSPPTFTPQPAATLTDALHAPYEHVLAAVYGGEAPSAPVPAMAEAAPQQSSLQQATKPVGWPCTKCGEFNDFERLTCSICLAPFGDGLRSEVRAVDRKKILVYALIAGFVFLLFVAAVTFASTKVATTDTGETQQTIEVEDEPPAEELVDEGPVVPSPAPTEIVVVPPGQSAAPAPNGEIIIPGQNLLSPSATLPAP